MRVYAYRKKYLCTACRISMSRIWKKDVEMKCGRCGADLAEVHHKFRAPPARDVKFWKVIQFLQATGSLALLAGRHIPLSLKEAEEMIAKVHDVEIANASITLRQERREKRVRSDTTNKNRERAAKQRRWRNLSVFGTEKIDR